MLPNLKRCLKLPRDHALLQKLEATVRLVISSELDTEASVTLREAVEELDQVNVSMEVVSALRPVCVIQFRHCENAVKCARFLQPCAYVSLCYQMRLLLPGDCYTY